MPVTPHLSPTAVPISGSLLSNAVATIANGRSAVSLVVDAKAPGAARQHALQIAQDRAVHDDVVGVVQLLVSELVTNVLQHQRSALVDVEVTVDANHAVTVAVCGSAGGLAVPMLHPMPSTDVLRTSGRGLAILDTLATTWGVRRATGRTTVWFTVEQVDAASSDASEDAAQAVLATASASPLLPPPT